jgi:hypothetical protein
MRDRPMDGVTLSAPHDEVMPQASVIVIHCVHGTMIRALAHGRAMLCPSTGRDQNDNAVRVTARGAGIRMQSDSDALSLRQALSTLLNDPSYAKAAAALGKAIGVSEPATRWWKRWKVSRSRGTFWRRDGRGTDARRLTGGHPPRRP